MGLDSAGRFSSCECKCGSLDAEATNLFPFMYAVKSGEYVRTNTKVAKQLKNLSPQVTTVFRARGYCSSLFEEKAVLMDAYVKRYSVSAYQTVLLVENQPFTADYSHGVFRFQVLIRLT